ncbi:MAG: CPBP family intramembrane metalloprotease [Acidobacteria bacterium]|nr:CPBP family intramembrane metalloprotease [Acidobacteriota bacterium]
MSLMRALIESIEQHGRTVKVYPVATLVLLAIAAQILYTGWIKHTLTHSVGYLLAVWCGLLLTDVVVKIAPAPAVGFPIKHPVMQESLIIIGSIVLGMVLLIVRFSPVWTTIHGLGRVSLFVLLLLFVFPIALALVFLFIYRYKLRQLGINLQYWYLPIFINLLFGGITLAVAPELSHWKIFFRGTRFFGALYTGIITAGLAEEFTRMLLQTRLGHAFHNKGIGFVVATSLWASMHMPLDWSQHPHKSFMQIVIGALQIIPIGLFWGYLTHRTKSLLPAVLTHGLNLWGIQNSL